MVSDRIKKISFQIIKTILMICLKFIEVYFEIKKLINLLFIEFQIRKEMFIEINETYRKTKIVKFRIPKNKNSKIR